MGVDAKFLDDGSIIRKDSIKVEVDEEPVEEQEVVEEQEAQPVKQQEPSKKKKPKKAAAVKQQKPVAEDRRVIALRELIDRTELQRASRWVDVRVNQRLYNMAMSNEERKRCE